MIWETVLVAVHVLVAAALVGLVLLQHGKGADMGAAFGGGSAGSLFGSAGSANFLSRTTAILAAVFFATSIVLTWLSGHPTVAQSVMQRPAPAAPAKPVKSDAVPGSAPATPATSSAPATPGTS